MFYTAWGNGKTKRKVIHYIGTEVVGKPVRRIGSSSVKGTTVKRHLTIENINWVSEDLKLTGLGNLYVLSTPRISSMSTSRLYGSLN